MAIQFFCAGCRQPIEIDDEWAGKPVTCPYCNKVVSAPLSSDPAIGAAAPAARSADAGVPLPPPPLPRGNVWSWIALASLLPCLVGIAAMISIAAPIANKVGPNPTPQDVQIAMQEEFPKHPGTTALALLGVCGAPIVGIICAIVALAKRTPPRWPAIVALVLYAALLVVQCAALLRGASTAAGSS